MLASPLLILLSFSDPLYPFFIALPSFLLSFFLSFPLPLSLFLAFISSFPSLLISKYFCLSFELSYHAPFKNSLDAVYAEPQHDLWSIMLVHPTVPLLLWVPNAKQNELLIIPKESPGILLLLPELCASMTLNVFSKSFC